MSSSGLKLIENRRSDPRVYQQPVPDDAVRHSAPLLDHQYFRLLCNKPRDALGICMAIQFRSAFDPDAAQATWGELVERHPGLRLCLEIPKHATRLRAGRASILENVPPPDMTLEDLRGLARDEQERCVRREFQRLGHLEWHFDRWPLHHFSLLCVADDELHLFFASDHTIADALGEVMLLGEFLEIYTARLAGRVARLAPAISAAEYAGRLALVSRYQPTAEELALVKDELERPPEYSSLCLWNPNRSKASVSERRFEVRSGALNEKATSALLKKTAELNCSMNSVVLAAFLRTLAVHPHPKKIAIQLATSGTNYPDAALDGVLAGFALCAPADFEVPDPDARFEDVLAAVHAQAHIRLNSGVERALARVLADQAKKVPLVGGTIPEQRPTSANDTKRANLCFSYLGHTRFGPASKDVEVTRIRMGGTNPACSVECQSLIFGERLMLLFVFDSPYFDALLIERFLDRCAAELEIFSRPTALSAGPSADASPVPASHTGKVATQLLDIAAGTLHLEITPDELSLDLEGDLGVDSLQRVRLAAHLYSRSLKTLDRDALLGCRTLAQMASVIEGHYPDGFADS